MNKVYIIFGRRDSEKEVLRICNSFLIAQKWRDAYLYFGGWEEIEIQDWLISASEPSLSDIKF